MSVQLTLQQAVEDADLKEEEKEQLKQQLEPPKKRIRYDVPNYLNFYSLYQYDRDKFRELLREWLKTPDGINRTLETLKQKQDEILEQCYILDENGKKLRDSDEKHIYRYKTLFDIQRAIYDKIQWEFIHKGSIFIIDDMNLDYDDQTAEIKGTEWKMSIKDRIIIHIRLLRLLRKGLSITDSIKLIKKGG